MIDPMLDDRPSRGDDEKLLEDQREANSRMVAATIDAHELRDQAKADLARSEESGRELRETAELRELFVGILGHDLRNPLGSISMAAGLLLQRGHLDQQDEKTVGRIITSSQRIARMVTQLLDLTRVRLGGGLLLALDQRDLGVLCRDAIDELDNRRIELTVTGDLTGQWDGDRLTEVISNILGNALEHASEGTMVRVAVAGVGAMVVVEISNLGLPISDEVLPSIFAPFRRGRERVSSKNGNLGLGLYIAHQIAIAHGGSLSVDSTPTATTFILQLPRVARYDSSSA